MKEPLLLTLCTVTAATVAATEEAETETATNGVGEENSSKLVVGKPKLEVPPNMMLDSELYEGIVSQPIIEPTVSNGLISGKDAVYPLTQAFLNLLNVLVPLELSFNPCLSNCLQCERLNKQNKHLQINKQD